MPALACWACGPGIIVHSSSVYIIMMNNVLHNQFVLMFMGIVNTDCSHPPTNHHLQASAPDNTNIGNRANPKNNAKAGQMLVSM